MLDLVGNPEDRFSRVEAQMYSTQGYKMEIVCFEPAIQSDTRPRGYKTFFKLSSAEHEISTAHRC